MAATKPILTVALLLSGCVATLPPPDAPARKADASDPKLPSTHQAQQEPSRSGQPAEAAPAPKGDGTRKVTFTFKRPEDWLMVDAKSPLIDKGFQVGILNPALPALIQFRYRPTGRPALDEVRARHASQCVGDKISCSALEPLPDGTGGTYAYVTADLAGFVTVRELSGVGKDQVEAYGQWPPRLNDAVDPIYGNVVGSLQMAPAE